MLVGRWRVEVSPHASRKQDVFLHVLQVGDASLQAMSDANLVERGGYVGVQLHTSKGDATVVFTTDGPAGGHVKLIDRQTPLVDQPLAQSVSPQSGIREN